MILQSATSIRKMDQWSLPILGWDICFSKYFLSKFSVPCFPMPCKRLNLAQCLTVMVFKNQTRCLKQLPAQLDKSDTSTHISFSPSPRCRDSSDMATTKRKTSHNLKNICSSIQSRHIYPSTNSHQHSWIRIINWSIKCVPSTISSSNARMWIHA